MTNKKQLLKTFLEKKVDFNQLQADFDGCWLRHKSRTFLYGSGVVSSHFNYTLITEAIKYAGYIYPKSDKTWSTVQEVQRELLDKYIK